MTSCSESENWSSVSYEEDFFSCRCVWVNGPVIVGAGPSGLATAACLRRQGVPFMILEGANCIASLWKKRTYDRLELHLPKQFSQLPYFPFSENFPEYPTKNQFIEYLESYSKHFEINPRFNESVKSAMFDEICGVWRVRTVISSCRSEREYICRWLIVATGENAERIVPEIDGMSRFSGSLIHASDYKSGEKFSGEKVVVVGCGNSGMEIALDLCNYNASPLMVVRSSVHVLPREILGKSTFELAVSMMKWLPLRIVDKILLILAWLAFGNIEKYGLRRPLMGPLELKNTKGKTPVLEMGALEKIRSGQIKIVPEIKSFEQGKQVEFINGEKIDVDSVILATGYRSNVLSWLQDNDLFSENGFPKAEFPHGWKGKRGLYAVGFTRRGLSGATSDAIKIAQDLGQLWMKETDPRRQTTISQRRSTA